MKKLKLSISLFFLSTLLVSEVSAFCGFYVAKADAQLFNESSQVIIARDGNHTTITMSNDFKGDVKDFAMVVPVPEVLKEKDIRIANASIFSKLDAYSGPRLVEYHDENPCAPVYIMERALKSGVFSVANADMMEAPETRYDYKVVIEAEYTVGEYDILILSAEESDGLERWLVDNGYKIPEQAKEVLEPYIKSDMKFFVVKVNLDERKKSAFESLRPLQISFESEKFMLPIRLGMANAKSTQDLIIYALTKRGRVETANYRTVRVPSNVNIPTFVKEDFGSFYKAVYDKAWDKEYRNSVMLEYSWDLSSNNFVKCDPCATTPPKYSELREAGVDWVQMKGWKGGSDYEGNVYFTRLHVRYDRKNFPQDLAFQETPNKLAFQGRYIMTHPAQGELDCEEAQAYFKQVADRRKKELKTLASLTGWDMTASQSYVKEYTKKIKSSGNTGSIDNLEKGIGFGFMLPNINDGGPDALMSAGSLIYFALLILFSTGLMYVLIKEKGSIQI